MLLFSARYRFPTPMHFGGNARANTTHYQSLTPIDKFSRQDLVTMGILIIIKENLWELCETLK